MTGASGFIGRALTKRLLAEGIEVWAVATAREKLADLVSDGVHVTVCDFAHYGELAGLLPKDVDWFIHAAWAGFYGPPSRDLAVQAGNISAAAAAMEQAGKIGVTRFLLLGSSYQYRMEPVTENGREVFIRSNIYGIAKEAAGRMLRAKAAEYAIAFNSALFTNVFGPGDRSARSTNTMIRQLLKGEPLRLISGEHLHDWTYIDDAVEGLMAVLDRGAAGAEYYIGKRHLETFRQIVTRVRDIVAPEAELRFGAYEDRAYIDYTMIDLDALYRDTGFECKADFEESIRMTAESLKMEKNTTGGGYCKDPIAASLPWQRACRNVRRGGGMRAVVTGASGFIGRALTRKLLAGGWQVYAVVRNPETLADLPGEGLTIVQAELGEYGQLGERMSERGFDAFFHLAWDGTSGASFRDYHRQMKNAAFAGDALLAAVELKAARFILAETIVELEAKHYMTRDGGQPRVSCIYGTAKAAADMVCRTLAYQNGMAFNGAVLASAYGEGDRSHMVQNTLIRAFQQGKTPKLAEGGNLYDWIYVDDVARALIAIAEKGRPDKTYYVGHRELQTFEYLVRRTRDIVAPEAPLTFGTLEDKTVTDWSLIDRDALYRDTGFACKADFEESIRKTAEWVKTLSF